MVSCDDCVALVEAAKTRGMQDGELSLEVVLDLSREISSDFSVPQVRAAYARAACYCLGEHVANIDETPSLQPDADRLVDQYKASFTSDL